MLRLCAAVALCALAFAAAPGGSDRAVAARPELSGSAFGIELCPQLLCGAATFVGYFGGDVDGRRVGGWWLIAARHDALPDAGASAAVTGGRWSLSIAGRRTTGAIAGGRIHNNGDDTFAITVTLEPASADGGALTFTGTLDHRRFPPTARGTLAAPAAG